MSGALAAQPVAFTSRSPLPGPWILWQPWVPHSRRAGVHVLGHWDLLQAVQQTLDGTTPRRCLCLHYGKQQHVFTLSWVSSVSGTNKKRTTQAGGLKRSGPEIWRAGSPCTGHCRLGGRLKATCLHASQTGQRRNGTQRQSTRCDSKRKWGAAGRRAVACRPQMGRNTEEAQALHTHAHTVPRPHAGLSGGNSNSHILQMGRRRLPGSRGCQAPGAFSPHS